MHKLLLFTNNEQKRIGETNKLDTKLLLVNTYDFYNEWIYTISFI